MLQQHRDTAKLRYNFNSRGSHRITKAIVARDFVEVIDALTDIM